MRIDAADAADDEVGVGESQGAPHVGAIACIWRPLGGIEAVGQVDPALGMEAQLLVRTLAGNAVCRDGGWDAREPRQQRHDASGHRRMLGEHEVRAAQVPDDPPDAGEPSGRKAYKVRVVKPRHDHVGA